MAKQLVSPMERHLDKAVLGLAGLVLIGAVARYLVTSPNQIELQGEAVSPKSVDERVADRAAEVRARLSSGEPDVEMPELLADAFEAALAPFGPDGVSTSAPRVARFGAPVPTVGAVVVVGNISPVEVVQIEQPIVSVGRSNILFQMEAPKGSSTSIVEVKSDTNWVTIAGRFDRAAQQKAQKDSYQTGRDSVVVVGVDLQRREMRPTGEFSDEDWQDVKAYRPTGSKTPPKIPLEHSEGQTHVTRATGDLVKRYLGQLKEGRIQLGILRPLPPDMKYGTAWTLLLMEGDNRRVVLLQDDEILRPKDQPADPLVDRYPDAVDLEQLDDDPDDDLTPQQRTAQAIAKGDALLKRAKAEWSSDLAIMAYNEYAGVLMAQGNTKALKAKLQQKMAAAYQQERDIIRNPDGPPGLRRDTRPSRGVVRKLGQYQQVWVHDALPDSVAGGKTYQYRLRVRLYNKYAAEPKKLRNPEDAARVSLVGQWSNPTEPVHIPAESECFLTSYREKGETVGFEVFQWFEGVWVKNRFAKYAVGDMVARTDRAKIPDKYDRSVIENALVPFNTGEMILDIDFECPHRDRKRGSRRPGVKFDYVKPRCCVALVDDNGRVQERFIATDKANPARRAAAAREFKPRRRADEPPSP